MSQPEYEKILLSIPGLKQLVEKHVPTATAEQQLLLMEFLLNGLSEFSQLSKNKLDREFQFKDLVSSMFGINDAEEDDETDFGFSNN
jgi:magnesium chelatase subunit I